MKTIKSENQNQNPQNQSNSQNEATQKVSDTRVQVSNFIYIPTPPRAHISIFGSFYNKRRF